MAKEIFEWYFHFAFEEERGKVAEYNNQPYLKLPSTSSPLVSVRIEATCTLERSVLPVYTRFSFLFSYT